MADTQLTKDQIAEGKRLLLIHDAAITAWMLVASDDGSCADAVLSADLELQNYLWDHRAGLIAAADQAETLKAELRRAAVINDGHARDSRWARDNTRRTMAERDALQAQVEQLQREKQDGLYGVERVARLIQTYERIKQEQESEVERLTGLLRETDEATANYIEGCREPETRRTVQVFDVLARNIRRGDHRKAS